MSYSRLTNYQFNIWLGSLSMLKWDKALASHSKFKMISIDPPKKARFSLDQVFKKFQVNHPYKGGKALHRF